MKAAQGTSGGRRTGLARALSKLGYCSRREAWTMIAAGRVQVNGVVARDPERRVDWGHDPIAVDGAPVRGAGKVYLMLNKPRGLVTSAGDEHGRDTVFACLEGAALPHISPVGRLDKASEGLLLFTNDTAWAARISDPASHFEKTYHAQIDCLADAAQLRRMEQGVQAGGDFLAAKRVRLLRSGSKHCWLEIVLVEGRNRHIRRLVEALGATVLRLVRVAIGPLELGSLAKGQWRHLTAAESASLGKWRE